MPDPDDPLRRLEARALALLARREYTRTELARRLARVPGSGWDRRPGRAARDASVNLAEALADEFAPPPQRRPAHASDADQLSGGGEDQPATAEPPAPELIETVLDRLTARRLLSDRRAADAIVHARSTQRGLLRVRQELEQKGVPEEVASEALAGLAGRQVALARGVWAKRFGVLPTDLAERQRQTRFLASRGFSFPVIRTVLDGTDAAPDGTGPGHDEDD
jgi:regulatory protein